MASSGVNDSAKDEIDIDPLANLDEVMETDVTNAETTTNEVSEILDIISSDVNSSPSPNAQDFPNDKAKDIPEVITLDDEEDDESESENSRVVEMPNDADDGNDHSKTHWSDGNTFSCNFCPDVYTNATLFFWHLNRYHQLQKPTPDTACVKTKNVFKCGMCKKQLFHEQNTIKSHLQDDHNLTLNNYERLFPHVKRIKNPLKSKIESETIASKMPKVLVPTWCDGSVYQCPDCPFQCRNQEEVKIHLFDVHGKDKGQTTLFQRKESSLTTCAICEETFACERFVIKMHLDLRHAMTIEEYEEKFVPEEEWIVNKEKEGVVQEVLQVMWDLDKSQEENPVQNEPIAAFTPVVESESSDEVDSSTQVAPTDNDTSGEDNPPRKKYEWDRSEYKCPYCPTITRSEQEFDSHIRSSHKGLASQPPGSFRNRYAFFTCHICFKKFIHEKAKIVVHLQTHGLGLDQYEEKYMKGRSGNRSLQVAERNGEGVEATVRDKSEQSDAEKVEGKSYKWDRSEYICPFCSRHYDNCTNFSHHLRTIHRGLAKAPPLSFRNRYENFVCKICLNVVLHERIYIYQHLNRVHSLNLQQYEEEYLKGATEAVNKHMDGSDSIKRKRTRYSNGKSDWCHGTLYKCPFCDEQFRVRNNFRLHLKNEHAGKLTDRLIDFRIKTSMFTCGICGKMLLHERVNIQQHLFHIHEMDIRAYEEKFPHVLQLPEVSKKPRVEGNEEDSKDSSDREENSEQEDEANVTQTVDIVADDVLKSLVPDAEGDQLESLDIFVDICNGDIATDDSGKVTPGIEMSVSEATLDSINPPEELSKKQVAPDSNDLQRQSAEGVTHEVIPVPNTDSVQIGSQDSLGGITLDKRPGVTIETFDIVPNDVLKALVTDTESGQPKGLDSVEDFLDISNPVVSQTIDIVSNDVLKALVTDTEPGQPKDLDSVGDFLDISNPVAGQSSDIFPDEVLKTLVPNAESVLDSLGEISNADFAVTESEFANVMLQTVDIISDDMLKTLAPAINTPLLI